MEQGSINSETGANASSSSIIRSKNYIEIPNGIEKLKFIRTKVGSSAYAIGLRFYDSSKNYLGYISYLTNGYDFPISMMSNAKYFRFIDLTNDLTNNYKITTDLGNIKYTTQNIGSVDYLIQSKNLLNMDKLLVGRLMDANGVMQSNSAWTMVNDFIVTNNNTFVTMSRKTADNGQWIFIEFDENFNILWRKNNSLTNVKKFTYEITNDNTKYLMVGFRNDFNYDELQLEYGTMATEYELHQEQSLAITLPEGMELCKIGDYRDYIYFENGKWFKHKEIGKVVLDGTEDWDIYGTGTSNWFYKATVSSIDIITDSNANNSNCDYYRYGFVGTTTTTEGYYIVKNSKQVRIRYGTEGLASDFATWLTTHNVTMYYALGTPIDEEITNEETLNILNNMFTYKGLNYLYCMADLRPSNVELQYYPNTAFNENVIKEFHSEIIRTQESILLTVSENYIDANNNDYVKQNDLEETIEGLQNKLLEKGGNNEFYYAKEFWTNGGSGTANLTELKDEDIKDESVSGFGYYINNGVSQQEQSVRNGIYTISFKYKKVVGNAVGSVSINDETAVSLTSTTWAEIIYPVTVTTNIIRVKFTSDSNNGFKITDLMVTYGSDKQIWTQNPNETRTDTVTIGKGIQVESSTVDTFTRIDADGTRIYKRGSNTPSTRFTDEGTETNQIKAGKGEISGISMKIVDNQTWLSSIL